jgi:hypothetical protein
MEARAFDEIVTRVGSCIRRARQLSNLSEDEVKAIDTQIELSFQLIESDFQIQLADFLERNGITERLRKISLSVVKALNSIDGYNVQPEVGMITIIRGSIASSQPLTPLASASSLYFNITPEHPHFDFILACLSRQEYFEVLQLHHYFRNQPARGSYRAGFHDSDDEWDDENEETPSSRKKKAS